MVECKAFCDDTMDYHEIADCIFLGKDKKGNMYYWDPYYAKAFNNTNPLGEPIIFYDMSGKIYSNFHNSIPIPDKIWVKICFIRLGGKIEEV